MTNYRSDVGQLLDQWVDEPGQGKNIVNCLIDWLYADGWWLMCDTPHLVPEYTNEEMV